MKTIKKDIKLSKTQIKKLQQRVIELEQTLQSIQSGEVDALIMKNKKGEASVFTLEGADQPYRMLVESMSEGAITLAEDGKIIHCNKRFSEMIKIPVNNIIGTSFFKYISETERDSLKKILDKENQQNSKGEFSLHAIDHSMKTVLLSCQHLKFGDMDGISIVATDISELKKMEQRYRSVMENATCGIFIIDKKGMISDLNNEAAKIFGGKRKQMIGTDFKNFIRPSEREYATVLMQKVLIDKRTGPNVVHIQQQNNHILDVEFSSVYVDNGEENFIFSILNDITERNRLHAQMLLSDKLVAVGTLAAGIIHEINNPLTFVLSNLNYMIEQINNIHLTTHHPQKNLMLELNNIIHETIQETDKIRDIVYDLKGFARPDQDELKTVDIHDILNTVIHIAAPQFKNHIILEKDFATDLPLLLLNSGKLNQVFLNLMINAIQAMKEDGVQKNIIHIKTYTDHNRICIDITDNGKGISPESLPKVFDPFFTTKPVGIGTGLGLSISYDIIHELGGQISVNSEIGIGSTFSVCLPINLIAEKSFPLISKTQNITNKKILVVDDEPTLLITLGRILGKDNQVMKAVGGKAAYDLLLKKNQFDLIISDLNMPDLNGADLFRYLVQNNPDLAHHMIFITGGSYTSSITHFLSNIKNPCIEKPFTKEQLLQAINSVLEVKISSDIDSF